MASLHQQLRAYIIENYLFGEPMDFADTDSFMELGIIDSTGVLELVSHLETEYGIAIGTEEIVPDNFDTIDRLAKFLARKTSSADVPCASSARGPGEGA
jgi:acyl carrier protein